MSRHDKLKLSRLLIKPAGIPARHRRYLILFWFYFLNCVISFFASEINASSNKRFLHRIISLIPFLDLKAQYLQMKPEIDAAVLRAIDSTQYVQGPEVAAFEKRFAPYCGVEQCLAVNTGTSACIWRCSRPASGPATRSLPYR